MLHLADNIRRKYREYLLPANLGLVLSTDFHTLWQSPLGKLNRLLVKVTERWITEATKWKCELDTKRLVKHFNNTVLPVIGLF